MKELELEGKNVPVIRILPNTACLIGKGFILIEQGDSYTKEQEDEFRYILREAGGFDGLPASQFVAGTVLDVYSPRRLSQCLLILWQTAAFTMVFYVIRQEDMHWKESLEPCSCFYRAKSILRI